MPARGCGYEPIVVSYFGSPWRAEDFSEDAGRRVKRRSGRSRGGFPHVLNGRRVPKAATDIRNLGVRCGW